MSEPQSADKEYEDAVLEKVEPMESGWVITSNGGSLGIPSYDGTPKAGDKVRYYGKGFGYPVRGVVIADKVVYYRTAKEDVAKHLRDQEDRDHEKRAKAYAEREATAQRINALPEPLQRRIQKFRAANLDFDWKFLDYELMCCEQAHELAKAFPTTEGIAGFHKLPWEEQKNAFPQLDTGHSGNSFGMMCRLAHHLVSNPENAVREHGALTALVGCKDYGCPHP